MDESELETLFNDLESDRVERKSSVSKDAKSKIREVICAFANDLPNYQKPGVLFVGVNDGLFGNSRGREFLRGPVSVSVKTYYVRDE